MKRHLVYLVLIMVLMAILLCACEPKKPIEQVIPEDGWITLSTVTPSDVYTKLLGGFTSIAGDFSKSSIRQSPKLSVDTKLKLVVNNNPFWVTLKANYLNTAPADTMLALEVSTEEDKYTSNILEVYLYKEKLSIGIGETKISFAMPADNWTSAFPFDIALDSSDAVQKTAILLAQTVDLEDESIVGKTRLNGTVEEYCFDFKIVLPTTLKKIFDFINNNTDATYKDIVDKYGAIITNIFGVTMDEVRTGDFPDSTVKLSFTTSSRKISAFKLNFDVDISKQKDTMLFPGENLKIDLELMKFVTSKKDNVSIDFVVNNAKQSKYISYVDKAFKVSADMTMYGATQLDYKLNVTAKIFQKDSIDNYLFLEVLNSKNAIVKAVYFYKNRCFYYDWVNNKLECVYKFYLDVSEVAAKIVDNDFKNDKGEPLSQLNVLNMVSYFIGSLRINDDGVRLIVKDDFFTNVWFNFDNLVDYINSLYVEDLAEITELVVARDFLAKNHYSLFIEYSQSLIKVLEDTDTEITNITNKLETVVSLNTLTPVDVGANSATSKVPNIAVGWDATAKGVSLMNFYDVLNESVFSSMAPLKNGEFTFSNDTEFYSADATEGNYTNHAPTEPYIGKGSVSGSNIFYVVNYAKVATKIKFSANVTGENNSKLRIAVFAANTGKLVFTNAEFCTGEIVGLVQRSFTKLVAQPTDWANNFRNYSTSNTDYVAIVEVAPTWETGKYYAAGGGALLASKPSNWETHYTSYSTTGSGVQTNVVGVAPNFASLTNVYRVNPEVPEHLAISANKVSPIVIGTEIAASNGTEGVAQGFIVKAWFDGPTPLVFYGGPPARFALTIELSN